MKCTITTDISYNQGTKVAAYAFWISGLGPSIKRSGLFKNLLESPDIAEIFCIANALVYVLDFCPNVEKIWVNTDSQTAIRMFSDNDISNRPRNQKFQPALKIVRSLQKKYPKLDIEYRKVTAHNGTHDKRSYVNDWADRESRKIQKKESKRLRNEQAV